MGRYTKVIAWALVALIIVGLVVYKSVKKSGSKDNTSPATTQGVTKGPASKALHVNAEILTNSEMSEKSITTGSVQPAEEVDLIFETNGKIVGIYFQEGEFVKKGTILAKINDDPLKAQLKKLEAQIQLSQDRVYRQQTLLEKDAVSHEAYESVVTEHNKLLADIELVKANIALTELKAPFDGIIGLRAVSEGAFANSNTIIAKLTQVSNLKIDFSVPETYASEVRKGQEIVFKLSDDQGVMRSYTAKIYAVESKVDINTRTLKVRAIFPNNKHDIIPGRFVSVELTKSVAANAISVPAESIIPEMGKNVVYVYNNGKAEQRIIDTGLRTDARVQALSGVNAGDTLLISGVMQLRKGMSVVLDNIR